MRTYPDLMMERTRSQHSTLVDSLPLYHHETETVALKEVLNLAVLCEFPLVSTSFRWHFRSNATTLFGIHLFCESSDFPEFSGSLTVEVRETAIPP